MVNDPRGKINRLPGWRPGWWWTCCGPRPGGIAGRATWCYEPANCGLGRGALTYGAIHVLKPRVAHVINSIFAGEVLTAVVSAMW